MKAPRQMNFNYFIQRSRTSVGWWVTDSVRSITIISHNGNELNIVPLLQVDFLNGLKYWGKKFSSKQSAYDRTDYPIWAPIFGESASAGIIFAEIFLTCSQNKIFTVVKGCINNLRKTQILGGAYGRKSTV